MIDPVLFIDMFCLFAAAIFAQGSLYASIAPHPTGSNGYEEYLRAADIVSSPEYWVYASWLDHIQTNSHDLTLDKPFDVDVSDVDLVVRRKMINRFGEGLAMIGRGNLKPVYDPRESISPDTTFRELSVFRSLARLEAHAAHVAFADGESARGLHQIEEGLVFGGKISGGLLIFRLVGIACETILLRELSDHWEQLSLQDTQELQGFLANLLSGPSPLVSVFQKEKNLSIGMIGDLANAAITNNTERLGVYFEGSQANVGKDLAKLSGADARSVVEDAVSQISAKYDAEIARLSGPESNWLPTKESLELDNSEDDPKAPLSSRLATMILPVTGQAVVAEVKNRTWLRLAYLTARAAEFRWLHGRLPNQIQEFTTIAERTDPTNGKPFQYRYAGRWFQITRTANDALGNVQTERPPRVANGGDSANPA